MTKTIPKPIISIFIHCYPPARGGAEYLTEKFVEVLKKKHDVHVFTGKGETLDSYKTIDHFLPTDPNSNIHRLELNQPLQRIYNKLFNKIIFVFGHFSPFYFGPILKYTHKEIQIIRRSKIIFGIAMPTKSFLDAYFYAHKFKKKLILVPTYHNVNYYNRCQLFQKAFNYAYKIIFLTNFEKIQIMKNYRILESKTIINTYCPFTIKEIRKQSKVNLKRKYNFSKPIIGYVGQISSRKNLFIFDSLLKKGYKVIFAGAKTNDSPLIEAHFSRYISTKKLTIIYDFPVSNKEKIFNKIDFFINPSAEESLGIVNFEAIYYGTPIIVNQSSAFYNLSPNIPSFDQHLDKHLLRKIIVNDISKQYTIFDSINFDMFISQLNLLIK